MRLRAVHFDFRVALSDATRLDNATLEHIRRRMSHFGNQVDERVTLSVVRTGAAGGVNSPDYLDGLSRLFNFTVLEAFVKNELYVAGAPPPPLPPVYPGFTVLEEGLVANCPAGQQSVSSPGGPECVTCQKGGYCVGSEFVRCPAGKWTNLTGRNSSSDCLQCPVDVSCSSQNCKQQAEGIDCTTGDEVRVRSGYFAHSPYSKYVFACANRLNCHGSLDTTLEFTPSLKFGVDSCAPGHTGILCGRCKPQWFRARRVCKPCSAERRKEEALINDTVVAMVVAIPLISIVTVLALLVYLKVWSPRLPRGRCSVYLDSVEVFFIRHITPQLPIATGLFKITLSYVQCLGAIARFDNILWPSLFDSFLRLLEELTIEVFTVLPVECVKGDRLGFGFELMVTLSLPLAYIVGIFLLLLTVEILQTVKRKVGILRSMEMKDQSASALQRAWKTFHSSRSYKLITLTMLVTCMLVPESVLLVERLPLAHGACALTPPFRSGRQHAPPPDVSRCLHVSMRTSARAHRSHSRAKVPVHL